MSRRRVLNHLFSLSVVLSLVLTSFLPALAQDTTIFLPITSKPSSSADVPMGPFRTRVTVTGTYQWQVLGETGVLLLDRGDDWATVLADDGQLEKLAKWGYRPERTMDWMLLQAASGLNTPGMRAVGAASSALRAVQAADGALSASSGNKQVSSAESSSVAALHAAVATLNAAEVLAITEANTTDSDGDGLTDTQEIYWCTSSTAADSDFDGASDGVEVSKLKDWLDNQLSAPPIDTAQPFNGWPFDNVTCIDNDRDSVPNLAERWELGLNMNIESTDRDRYDDGQELYGTTYCPGSGNACGYGQLPSANYDGILLFPQLPSWVLQPGNHPLVAALPKIEIEIVPDQFGAEFKLQTATVLTLDTRHEKGETKSYSTTKTEGTSTSDANTESWETWQEYAKTTEAQAAAAKAARSHFDVNINSTEQTLQISNFNTTQINQKFKSVTKVTNNVTQAAGPGYLATKAVQVGDFTLNEACEAVQCRLYGGAAVGATARVFRDIFTGSDAMQNAFQSNKCSLTGLGLGDIGCRLKSIGTLWNTNYDDRLEELSASEQQANGLTAGTVASGDGNSYMDMAKVYPLNYPMPSSFIPTETNTQGSSSGGSHTATTTQYEEHAITEGTAKQFSESWGSATAEDSSHAADLWFAYQVRNTGTDYARQICGLVFNVFIGDTNVPSASFSPATDLGGDGCLQNFRPGEQHQYTFPSQSRIAITLDEMKLIDLGGKLRIVVEDYSLGQDDYYADDAIGAGITFSIEDGLDDGNQTIDNYIIPVIGNETVLNVLARYFPYQTDATGMLVAIWTPEYQNGTPSWCLDPWRPQDNPNRVLWCKHTISSADWWNIFFIGLGNDVEGFEDSPAIPHATALFRFNRDSDLDGFSDETEIRLGTDPNAVESFPEPEVLAGIHTIRTGSYVTATISLLNTGLHDATNVEAVAVAPDDSISIANNTVGGSGRVQSQQQVIVGSHILLQSPLPAAWTQANHTVPAAGGYFTGDTDRTYTFTVTSCPVGGCTVGSGTWTLAWSDTQGISGTLNFAAGYASPTFKTVGAHGVTLALRSGTVQNGENFTVAANTPRDTFQYTINRTPYTEPVVIVSYNDPQGNHRFVLPSQAMSLTAPGSNLQALAGQMLGDVGVEIVTSQPFTPSVNSVDLLVNNPSDKTFVDAHLFLEFINVTGTVVSEVAMPVTLPPGPGYHPVSFSSGDFDPAFNPADDYIVMAFLTDYQGNILDTAGRPLSSFQVDPLPQLAVNQASLTWDFGTVEKGALLKHPLELANVGYGALYTYLMPTPGLSLSRMQNGSVGAADTADFGLTLHTAELFVGAYDQMVTLQTSDPLSPTITVHVVGSIAAATGNIAGSSSRPLDVPVTIHGPQNQGDWVTFTHNLGPEPQTLHPVKVYSPNYATLYGVGKYATDFAAGTASYDMFGDGRDGVMPTSGNLDNNNGSGWGVVNSGNAGSTSINLTDVAYVWRIQPGDVVLIHQTQGMGAGCWELNKAVSDFVGGTGTYQLETPLKCTYYAGGNNHAQLVRVPQYSSCNVTGTVTPRFAWNGSYGGILAVMCLDSAVVTGALINNGGNGVTLPNGQEGTPAGGSGAGYRGGQGDALSNDNYGGGARGEGYLGIGTFPDAITGNGGAAGGGSPATGNFGTGGGGGNGTAGSASTAGGIGAGGAAAGNPELTNMVFGGGGGGSNDNPGNSIGGGGGGGGIIFLSATSVSITGVMQSHGGTGGGDKWGGGAGAGGSIFIRGKNITLGASRVTVFGGNARNGGGAGGLGRIRVEYCESATGNTHAGGSPQKIHCFLAEQVEAALFLSGRLNLSSAIASNTAEIYTIQYGRRLTMTTGVAQPTTLRIPAGMLTTATLDALVSGLPTNATFALDIGNDGVDDWTGVVSNNSANAGPDLASAFNSYWLSQSAPTTGTLDVPVKVTLSQPGQVLLTNLQVTTAGSRLRTVRVAGPTLGSFLLDLAVTGVGGATALAVDIGADGSLEWSGAAAALPALVKTANLAAAANSFRTANPGVADLPVRIYVSPDTAVEIANFTATPAATTDLAAGTLQFQQGLVSAAELQAANYLVVGMEGQTVPVAATLANNGTVDSGPVTVAFFAGAPGWGDWYIGADFVANVPAGATVPVSTDWNTLGFQGDVPVKMVVNPYRRVAETTLANNTRVMTVTVDPPAITPIAAFTATNRSGYAPLHVQFTDTSTTTTSIVGRLWDFGDGAVSHEANPLHIYTQSGAFTVTLTVTDVRSVHTTARINFVLVGDPPIPPTAEFTVNRTGGDAPLAVLFTDTSTGDIAGRQWDFGDGATGSDSPVTHTFTNAGLYTATLTVSGPGGSDGKSLQILVSSGTVNAQIPLKPGWNLLSLPLIPPNPAPGQVMATVAGQYSSVWAFDACGSGSYKSFDPQVPAFANTLTTISPEKGLWVLATTTSTLSLDGTAVGPLSVQLCTDWNLVSWPRLAPMSPAGAFVGISTCLVDVYGISPTGSWQTYSPSVPSFANSLTTLQPGKGYWVRVSQPCLWEVPPAP